MRQLAEVEILCQEGRHVYPGTKIIGTVEVKDGIARLVAEIKEGDDAGWWMEVARMTRVHLEHLSDVNGSIILTGIDATEGEDRYRYFQRWGIRFISDEP